MCHTSKIIIAIAFYSSYVFSQNITWQHTGGPMGGIVEGIDIAQNGDIYAGGSNFLENYCGLYKSSDNGDTWQKIQTQFDDFQVYTVYVSKDSTIWVGTDGQDRIYRSTDNGKTWDSKSNGFNTSECWVIGENKDNVLFAGDANNGQMFRTTDKGNSWEFSGSIAPLSIASDTNNITYAGSFNGLYYSTDSGLTWNQHSNITYPISSIIVDSSNNIYLGTGYYDSGNGVFYSSDSGQSFIQIGLQNKVILSLAFNSKKNLLAGTLKDGLFKTSDNGINWSQYTDGIYSKQVFRIKVNKQNDIFIGSEGGGNGWQFYGGGGVFRSTNGGKNFEHIGLPNSKVKNIVLSGDSLLIASTPSGVQKYNNTRKRWENIGLHGIEAVSITKSDFIYAATREEGLFKSTDFGGTWKLTNLTIDTLMPVYNVLTLNNDTVFVTTGFQKNLRRTTDGGNTWGIFPIKGGETSRILYEHNNRLFVSGYVNTNNTLFSTSDLGVTFDTLFSGFDTGYLVSSFSIPNNNYIFLASNNDSIRGIFRYTTDNQNWENIFAEDIVQTVFSNDEGVVLTGSYFPTQLDSSKLFYSSNFGNNWSNFNLPITSGIYITDIKQDLNGHYFLGTSAAGVIQLDIITDVEDEPLIINDYCLYQNFPNPFNPVTKIKYYIPNSGLVKIVVCNALGQEIKTLISSYQNTGEHGIEFNGNNLASGVYFYSLITDEFVSTKKMILLK